MAFFDFILPLALIADNKQFICSIQQETQASSAIADKLDDIGDNASDAASPNDEEWPILNNRRRSSRVLA